MPKGHALDLTGQTFGRLTVLHKSERRADDGATLWTCRCICGKENMIRRAALRLGHTKSCGCLRSEATIARNKARWTTFYDKFFAGIGSSSEHSVSAELATDTGQDQ